MKSRLKNLLLLILFSSLIVSCHSNTYDDVRKSKSGFWVNIFENKLNSNELNIILETKSSSGNLDFKCEEYGKFKVISSDYKRGKFNRISLSVEKTSSNVLKINRADEIILIFIYADIKEEFIVTNIDNKIQIKSLQASKYFEFRNSCINTIPEDILCIRSYKLDNLSLEIIKNLESLNCKPLKLPLGYYSHFSLEAYNKNVMFAHKRKNSEHFMYFFNVKENYEKILQVLQTNKYNDNKSENYNFYFNFNIDSKIAFEKNGNKFITVKMPDAYNSNPTKSENNLNSRKISFNSDNIKSVEIEIYNSSGDLILTNNINFTLGGTYEYVWDGLLKNGDKATKGIYFYRLKLDGKNYSSKKMIIVK